MTESSIFSRRLRDARQKAELSQKALGVAAGIDEFSASPRMNQYERGKHLPDMNTVERLAKVLGVNPAYFFAKDDQLAVLLEDWDMLTKSKKEKLLKLMAELTA